MLRIVVTGAPGGGLPGVSPYRENVLASQARRSSPIAGAAGFLLTNNVASHVHAIIGHCVPLAGRSFVTAGGGRSTTLAPPRDGQRLVVHVRRLESTVALPTRRLAGVDLPASLANHTGTADRFVGQASHPVVGC